MTKRRPSRKVPVGRILNIVRTKLQTRLKQRLAEVTPYLVAAEKEGWPYDVQIVIEMPDDLVARLKEEGRKRAEEQLKSQLTPDGRLRLAAQDAQDTPQLVTTPAGKGHRSSDVEDHAPVDVVPPGEYETCDYCAGEGLTPHLARQSDPSKSLDLTQQFERAPCPECNGTGLMSKVASAQA